MYKYVMHRRDYGTHVEHGNVLYMAYSTCELASPSIIMSKSIILNCIRVKYYFRGKFVLIICVHVNLLYSTGPAYIL